jgi:hypothetical protein
MDVAMTPAIWVAQVAQEVAAMAAAAKSLPDAQQAARGDGIPRVLLVLLLVLVSTLALRGPPALPLWLVAGQPPPHDAQPGTKVVAVQSAPGMRQHVVVAPQELGAQPVCGMHEGTSRARHQAGLWASAPGVSWRHGLVADVPGCAH